MTLPWRFHLCSSGECARIVGVNSLYCCDFCRVAWTATPRYEADEHSAGCVEREAGRQPEAAR